MVVYIRVVSLACYLGHHLGSGVLVIKIWLDVLGDVTSTYTFQFGIGPRMQLKVWYYTRYEDVWVTSPILTWAHTCSISVKVN